MVDLIIYGEDRSLMRQMQRLRVNRQAVVAEWIKNEATVPHGASYIPQ